MNVFADNPLFVFVDDDISCKFAEVDKIIELSDVGCNARSPQSSFLEIERSEDAERSEGNVITRKRIEINGDTNDEDYSQRKYNDHCYGKKNKKDENRFESLKPSVNVFSSDERFTRTSRANFNLQKAIEDSFESISIQGSRKFRNHAVGEDSSLSNLSRKLNKVTKSSPSSVTFKLSDELDTSKNLNASRLSHEEASKKFTKKSVVAKTSNSRKECFSGIPVKKYLEQDKSESRPKKVTYQRERNDSAKISLNHGHSIGESVSDSKRKPITRTSKNPTISGKEEQRDSRVGNVGNDRTLSSEKRSSKETGYISRVTKEETKRQNVKNDTLKSHRENVKSGSEGLTFKISKNVNAAGIAKREEVNSNESKREKDKRLISNGMTSKTGDIHRKSYASSPARLERRNNKPKIFITTCHPGETPKNNKIYSTSKSSKRYAKGKTLHSPQGTKSDRAERVDSKLKLTEVNDVKEDPSSKYSENKGYDEPTIPVTNQSTVETNNFISSTKNPACKETDADRHELKGTWNSKGSKIDEMTKVTREELKREFVKRCFRDYESNNPREKSQEIVDIGVTMIENILNDQCLPSVKICRNYIDSYDATKWNKDRRRWFS